MFPADETDYKGTRSNKTPLGTFPFHIFQNHFLPLSILASLLESFKRLHSSLLAFLSIDRHMCTYTSGIFQGLPCYCPKQGTCQSSCISLQRFLSNQSVRFNPHSSTKKRSQANLWSPANDVPNCVCMKLRTGKR